LVDIVSATIERIALMGIEKILSETLFKKEADKDNMIRKQNTNLKRQIALQLILNAIGGGGGGGGLPFFAKGGAVSKGQPIVVGEQGAELFIPNSTGQITQSARGTDTGTTNINFTVNAVDVKGVEELLLENRSTIVNVINGALNDQGKEALV